MTETQIQRAHQILDKIQQLQDLKADIHNIVVDENSPEEYIMEYLTKIVKGGYTSVLYNIAFNCEKDIENAIKELEEFFKILF